MNTKLHSSMLQCTYRNRLVDSVRAALAVMSVPFVLVTVVPPTVTVALILWRDLATVRVHSYSEPLFFHASSSGT
jgi:hypothetical protein